MIFHALHCSARKVNMCYKTQGETTPAPSCPFGRQERGEMRGPSMPGMLALPCFTDRKTKVQRG